MENKRLILIGSIISLIIFPLLKPGYIISLDQVINPNGWMPAIGEHIYWVGILSKIFFSIGIPVWILEKLIIITTFVAPSYGIYLLTKDSKNFFAITFGIIFILFNPFLYARFLDGQINVYLIFAFFPLFFYSIKKFLSKKSMSSIFGISIFSLFLCLTSSHSVIFIAVLLVLFVGSDFLISKKRVKDIKYYLLLISSVFLINILWILPVFTNKNEDSLINQMQNFDNANFEVFKTDSGKNSIYLQTLVGKGYWGEREHRFLDSTGYSKSPEIIFLLILIIVVIGVYACYKEKEQKDKSFYVGFILLMIISYILSLGIGGNNIFSSLNLWLLNNIPFYNGLRETQKWSMFLIFGYAYFSVYGVKYIISKLDNSFIFSKLIIAIILLLPILYTPGMIWGFNNQITIREYPQDWYQTKNKLTINTERDNCISLKQSKSQKCYSTIAFPWHAYMRLSWTGKKVGGWIVQFFGDDVLFGDNVEIGPIYSTSTRPESKLIEAYIGPDGLLFKKNINENDLKNFTNELKGMGIQNLLLLKEVDYKKYKVALDMMNKLSYIKLIYESDGVVLYQLIY